MTQTVRFVGRAVVVTLASLLALTLLAGVVGAMWTMTAWGMHPGPHAGGGVGFTMGFGLPLSFVLLWATPLAVLFGLVYLLAAVGTASLRSPPTA